MASLNWCKKRKEGIKIIEPNENLSEEYLSSANETLKILKEIERKSNMWLTTTKYYTEYFAVYSVLMKIGVKSEIHDCTLLLVKFLEEKKIFNPGTYNLLNQDKQLRIDNQYYLKNKKINFSYDSLLNFVLEIKEILNTLNEEKIKEIRKVLKKLLK